MVAGLAMVPAPPTAAAAVDLAAMVAREVVLTFCCLLPRATGAAFRPDDDAKKETNDHLFLHTRIVPCMVPFAMRCIAQQGQQGSANK